MGKKFAKLTCVNIFTIMAVKKRLMVNRKQEAALKLKKNAVNMKAKDKTGKAMDARLKINAIARKDVEHFESVRRRSRRFISQNETSWRCSRHFRKISKFEKRHQRDQDHQKRWHSNCHQNKRKITINHQEKSSPTNKKNTNNS